MKVRTDAEAGMIIEELFEGVMLETREGNKLGVCQRDFGYEIHLFGKQQFGPIFFVNLETREITRVGKERTKLTDQERVEKLAKQLGLTPHPKHFDPIREALFSTRVDERDLCISDVEAVEMDFGDEHDEDCNSVTVVEDECNCHLSQFRERIMKRHSSSVLSHAASRMNSSIDESIVEKFDG